MVKAKDVRGFMIEKQKSNLCIHCHADNGLHQHETELCPKNGREVIYPNKQEWEDTVFTNNNRLFNLCIDQQGEREITLNREKLINLIGEFNGNLNFEYHIKLADDIIAAEADIIESPENDNK